MKPESNQSDIERKKCPIHESIATSISVENANIFLIADKKSIFLIFQ